MVKKKMLLSKKHHPTKASFPGMLNFYHTVGLVVTAGGGCSDIPTCGTMMTWADGTPLVHEPWMDSAGGLGVFRYHGVDCFHSFPNPDYPEGIAVGDQVCGSPALTFCSIDCMFGVI